MRVYLFVLFPILLSFSINIVTSHEYKDELDAYRDRMKGSLVFDQEANGHLRRLEKDIEHIKQLSFFKRMVLFMFSDDIVVTKDTMPKLYQYIQSLCEMNDLDLPTLVINMNSSELNARASSIGIFIGQKLLTDCSDEEIEAVISHEVGHLKYNHWTKSLGLSCFFVAILYYYMSTPVRTHDSRIFRMEKIFLRWEDWCRVYISIMVGNIVARLVIGKRFERQADVFACEQGNVVGLIAYFKQLIKLELKEKQNLWVQALGWVYHHTPFGAHPSPESRIKAAQTYLSE